ncbi:small integral membrane protein 19-like isoform X1 [Crotalus tigris]|uniref:small integral membrane protein 19-like isoform X1 n=1 Tax=Crotalus tigris TaxID=88082 RepID=UPI00192F30EA|nr:small integral membrane protein 19-like isoform X1 [Crotalus tigris]
MAGARALGESGGGGVAAMDYSVHEAWNEATNIYLLAVLASLALLVYARRNKRKIMRIFTLPPTVEISEPNFYDSMKKVRLRQQLEMYSIGILIPMMETKKEQRTIDLVRVQGRAAKTALKGLQARKYDHQQQPQKQTDSVQLLVE